MNSDSGGIPADLRCPYGADRSFWGIFPALKSGASVLSQKFIAESGGETADPSTPFAAKNATNCAQDDSAFVERMNDSVHQQPLRLRRGESE